MKPAVARRTLGTTGLQLSELGLGTAPLGNLYRPMSSQEAGLTVAAALEAGLTYLDTAPYYGFGLSERRLGDGVRGHPNAVLSTKVGRLLRPLPVASEEPSRDGFAAPLPFVAEYDYSYDGVMRSWEASLQRLGLARIDILYVHDIGAVTHGQESAERFRELTDGGGLRALEELRAGRVIAGFGVGVNECEVCLQVMEHARLDVILLAGRYTLLDQVSLEAFLPTCLSRGVSLVVGGVYNSGILATGTRSGAVPYYDYAPASPAVIQRVREIEAVCDLHQVSLPAAALQFSLAHPAVASAILGLGGPQQVAMALQAYSAVIPPAFWAELSSRGLLHAAAPIPRSAST